MTAIAWAIMFIGMIWYDAYFRVEIKEGGNSSSVGGLCLACLFMVVVCTIRELIR